jgi:hypothetical protein
MISQDRLTQALHDVADGVTAPEVDLADVRTRARSRRVRAVSAAAVAVTAAVAVIGVSTTLLGGGDMSISLPAASPLPSTAISATSPTGYTSAQYGFTIVAPAGWRVEPAERAWVEEVDARDWMGPAHDNFVPPDEDVVVSAWTTPLATGTPMESRAAMEAWIEDYCRSSGASPCTGIAERAVGLCPEQRKCTSGLLVPFTREVVAFFTGGAHGSDTMTVIAVWRPEHDPSVKQYGGARRLLEQFLEPIDVWSP